MEFNFYKYDNHEFVANGEILRTKEGITLRQNKDRNGRLRGSQIMTDTNGNILSIRYIDSNDNVLTTKYKDGEIVAKFQEKYEVGENGEPNFIKNGAYEEYRNGEVVKIGVYQNGKLQGRWMTIDENNNVDVKSYEKGRDISDEIDKEMKNKFNRKFSEAIEYLGDKNIGRSVKRLILNSVELFKKNSENKVPQIKINFKEMPNLKEGETEILYSTYYKDGSPNIISEEAKKINGEVQYYGKFLEHYDNGKIKINTEYSKEGKLNGKYKEYYENGEIKLTGSYENGLKVGIFKEYDSNGKLMKEENFNEIKNKPNSNTLNKENKVLKKTKIPKKTKNKTMEVGRELIK